MPAPLQFCFSGSPAVVSPICLVYPASTTRVNAGPYVPRDPTERPTPRGGGARSIHRLSNRHTRQPVTPPSWASATRLRKP